MYGIWCSMLALETHPNYGVEFLHCDLFGSLHCGHYLLLVLEIKMK